MALRYAILAALTDGPLHGYRVRTVVEERIGAFWPVSQGQVYATLDRLCRDGLIDVVDAPPHSEGVARRHYALEQVGRRALSEWLVTPGAMGGNDGLGFDDWLAHLAVCERWGEQSLLRQTIDVQRTRCRTLARALDQTRVTGLDDHAMQAARDILSAELEWLEVVERELSTDASASCDPDIDP